MADDDDQTPDEPTRRTRKSRANGSDGRKINRVELHDEGIRVLVEIEGLTAVRASEIIRDVLDKTFARQTALDQSGSVLGTARGDRED